MASSLRKIEIAKRVFARVSSPVFSMVETCSGRCFVGKSRCLSGSLLYSELSNHLDEYFASSDDAAFLETMSDTNASVKSASLAAADRWASAAALIFLTVNVLFVAACLLFCCCPWQAAYAD